jgi:5-methyltetrahydropteroyltriglutamate--homocysteine methyltransferase
VTLQQNVDRIRTTHIGSLPRPHELLDLMKAKYNGLAYDEKLYEGTITKSVAEAVRRQVECGIDFVTDGEFSKPGFFTYIQERLEGFEARPQQKMKTFQKEVAAFPEYYAPTPPCTAFPPRWCASTPATASTRGRAFTRRHWRTP